METAYIPYIHPTMRGTYRVIVQSRAKQLAIFSRNRFYLGTVVKRIKLYNELIANVI